MPPSTRKSKAVGQEAHPAPEVDGSHSGVLVVQLPEDLDSKTLSKLLTIDNVTSLTPATVINIYRYILSQHHALEGALRQVATAQESLAIKDPEVEQAFQDLEVAQVETTGELKSLQSEINVLKQQNMTLEQLSNLQAQLDVLWNLDPFHRSLYFRSIPRMAAIGLLDIPPEIQLQIAESVETRQALKALSVTSRSLRSIAQSILFKKLEIDLCKELRGLADDLLANPRICAAIRFLKLRATRLLKHDEQLPFIQRMLPEMVGLRQVSMTHVTLSKAFLDTFLEIAGNKPLQISLQYNTYPCGVISTPHTPLQISHIDLSTKFGHPSLEFLRPMFHASATTLTGLSVVVAKDSPIMKLADINLPFLHDLTLIFSPHASTIAAAFITAQMAVKKLVLEISTRPLPPLPPNALPDLRELIASPEQVNQLVPGRPVEVIDVTFLQGSFASELDRDWFGEEVTQSTAQVRTLRVHLKTAVPNTRMVKRMVTILLFLEDLWLPVFDHVSWPFRSITKTLAAHFLSDTPRCRRSPHFTQMPQEPRLQSASSQTTGRPQHQRHRYQTTECKFILLISRDSGRWWA